MDVRERVLDRIREEQSKITERYYAVELRREPRIPWLALRAIIEAHECRPSSLPGCCMFGDGCPVAIAAHHLGIEET